MLSSVILQSLRLAYASHLGFSKFTPTKKHHQRKILGGVRVFSAKNAEAIAALVLFFAVITLHFDFFNGFALVASEIKLAESEDKNKS